MDGQPATGAGEAPPAPPAKRSRGRPSQREHRREELIRVATDLFNERGISGTSLGAIAETLGINRASIYHYVDDRNELVFQCYMRACALAADDLGQAGEATTGFERGIAYIERAMTPDRPPSAVLTEINSLAPEIAKIIRDANDRNSETLKRFIGQGVADGSIRACDHDLSAQAIVGMIAWAQLLPQWSGVGRGSQLRARAAASMIDLLSDGLALDRAAVFRCGLRAADFDLQLSNIFDREESSALKLERVLATASGLFNRNGIEATSIDEIAARMGVTKGVLYHYLKDKPDLITQCYERSFALYERFVDASKTHSGDRLDAALINTHLNVQAQAGALSPLMPQPGFGALDDVTRARLQRRASLQNRTLANILQQGVEDGVARPCDALLVTHICAGAIGWIPKWAPVERLRDPVEMGDKICDIFRLGLRNA